MKQKFYSNGKLLLTGEYLVLDGATALAIPTKYGQSLEVFPSKKEGIQWQSLNLENAVWFHTHFKKDDTTILEPDRNDKITVTLLKILKKAKQLNPSFLNESIGWKVTTRLGFPQNWGLGTSSTLINNIAQWAGVDALALLWESFGGSGYDIAAAQNDVPFLYQLQNSKAVVEPTNLKWDFTSSLFFVHLNKKQDSKDGITRYKGSVAKDEQIDMISSISKDILLCGSLSVFEKLLQKHEEVISGIVQLPTIKEQLFNDYPNTIKSLGAWGGDFVLATGNETDKEYFRKKGFNTIIGFEEMVK